MLASNVPEPKHGQRLWLPKAIPYHTKRVERGARRASGLRVAEASERLLRLPWQEVAALRAFSFCSSVKEKVQPPHVTCCRKA